MALEEITTTVTRGQAPCLGRTRRGVSVLECLTSLVMLGVILTIVSQMVFQVDRLSRSRGEKLEASLVLQNTAERLVSLPWQQLNHDSVLELLTDEASQGGLPNLEPSVLVTPNNASLDAQRVTLTVAWPQRGDLANQQLSLTAEIYRNPRRGE